MKIPRLRENVSLAGYTTFKVGGKVRWLVEVKTEEDFLDAIRAADGAGVARIVVAGGSNILASDVGWNGLVIVNRVKGIKIKGNTVWAKSGTGWDDFVDQANKAGLAGIESMAGIPGTVGGAVYGNAGAFGQSTADHVVSVRVWDGKGIKEIPVSECEYGYRDSRFKRTGEIILEVKFEFNAEDTEKLVEKSTEIRKTREQKFPGEMKCAGSFFQNLIAADLPEEVMNRVPAEKIIQGKISAGYLLEQVGAKGRELNGVKVTDFHANIIINKGGAKAKDIWDLAMQLRDEVKEKFGIILKPEVQVIGEI